MNKNVIKHLFNLIRDDVRAIGLSLTRRDRAQARLLSNLAEDLALLEREATESETLTTGE